MGDELFYKYRREEGRKGKEMQMQTYICWSNKSQTSTKSVHVHKRKNKLFKYAFELRAR